MPVSDIIDTAIGMILVFLLVSLIASGINEAISQFFRWRARDLEDALFKLLENPDLVGRLYNHGLVETLTLRDSLWDKVVKKFRGRFLKRFQGLKYLRPSYIPNHTFVLALLSSISSYIQNLNEAKILAELKKQATADKASWQAILAKLAGQKGNTPSESEKRQNARMTELKGMSEEQLNREISRTLLEVKAKFDTLIATATSLAPPNPDPNRIVLSSGTKSFALSEVQNEINRAVTNAGFPPEIGSALKELFEGSGHTDEALKKLRDNLLAIEPFARFKIIPEELYEALSTLVNDTTISSVDGALANMENWFDDMMQRVSSLYKAKVQHFLLFIGLVIAVVLNADSLVLANVLWHNGPLRDSVVAAAQEIAKENLISGPAAAPTITSTNGNGTFGTNTEGLPLIQQVISETKSLQLPLGWGPRPGDASDPTNAPTALGRPLDDLRGWLFKLIGLVITTIAVSFGAPFWFDLLNKFVSVRSVLKPPAKPASEPKTTT